MRRLPLLALGLALAGCAGGPAAPPPAITDLGLDPASFGRAAVLDQMVRGTFGAETRSLRFRAEITTDAVRLVGLSALGAPLFTVESRSGTTSATLPPGVHLGFDPGHMLADFQIAHWPAATLRPALERRGLRLEEDVASQHRRVLDAEGTVLVEVQGFSPDRLDGGRVLLHYDRPYRLEIRTQATEVSP